MTQEVASRAANSERRPLTVLFADIANSTAIAERLDPEDWTAIVGEAFGLMNGTIERYEGTVARLMGDGVLAFFGAPFAHEDDPERAIRCGLAMTEAIGELGERRRAQTGGDLRLRVGINTGPVVVGMVGTDTAHEYTAMGDAVNIAARLQAHAVPGTVLVTAATYRFVAPIVDARDVGTLELKGKSDRVQAFEISGVRTGLVSARGLSGISSPMIGRDAQLARLRALFAVAKARQGRFAMLLGEPGIGKSRLLAEFRAAVEAREPEARWIEGRCLSYGGTLPYHLVVDVVRSQFGVSPAADATETRTVIERRTRELLGDDWAETFAYLAHLLSLPLEPDMKARISLLDFEVMKRYVAAIITILRAQSEHGPIVLVCEDLHWADAVSVDVLLGLVPLLAELPVVCVITTRLERKAQGWRLVSGARDLFGDALSEIRLDPLSPEDTGALVANLLEIESLPHVTRDLILAKAEGNPFFVEEVIRMLIDRRAIVRDGDRWVATADASEITIPDTLQGLLLARIDRLPVESKRTLRVASVIGRQFGVTLLERLLEGKAS